MSRMFFAPNRFAKLARLPGGKSRDAAIAEANHTIEDQREFLTEGVREAVLSIEAVVLGLEDAEISRPHSEIILRHCDRIIGLASVLGLASLEGAAKSLCDLIACLARAGKITKAPVVVHVQALHRLSERSGAVAPQEESVLLAQLARLLAHYDSRAQDASA